MSKLIEQGIERQILEFLKCEGIFAWKNYSTGTFDPTRKKFRKHKNKLKGVADILGILAPHGRSLAIEVKRPKTAFSAKTYPTKDQKIFLDNTNRNGGLGFVARSVDDVIEQLKYYFLAH